MLKSIVVTGLLFVSAGASAQPQRSAPESGSAGDNSSQVICRIIPSTESRLSRSRICRTRSEWEALRRDTRSTVDRAQTTRVNQSSN